MSVTPPTRRLAVSASAAKSLFAVPLKLTCRASTSSESAASPALSAPPGPRASAALGLCRRGLSEACGVLTREAEAEARRTSGGVDSTPPSTSASSPPHGLSAPGLSA